MSPGFTACGRREKDTETRCLSPVICSVVRVNASPDFNSIGSSASWPMRILGPGRSPMMAIRFPTSRDTARILSITFLCSTKSPWEKLSRATFIPARVIFSITSTDWEAGPMVQMILVLLAGSFTGVFLQS